MIIVEADWVGLSVKDNKVTLVLLHLTGFSRTLYWRNQLHAFQSMYDCWALELANCLPAKYMATIFVLSWSNCLSGSVVKTHLSTNKNGKLIVQFGERIWWNERLIRSNAFISIVNIYPIRRCQKGKWSTQSEKLPLDAMICHLLTVVLVGIKW